MKNTWLIFFDVEHVCTVLEKSLETRPIRKFMPELYCQSVFRNPIRCFFSIIINRKIHFQCIGVSNTVASCLLRKSFWSIWRRDATVFLDVSLNCKRWREYFFDALFPPELFLRGVSLNLFSVASSFQKLFSGHFSWVFSEDFWPGPFFWWSFFSAFFLRIFVQGLV